MAMVITQFIGFESGNNQEAYLVSGTPTYPASPVNSGNYSLQLEGAEYYRFLLDPAGLKSTPTYFVIGLYFQTDDVTPAADTQLIQLASEGGGGTSAGIGIDTSGKFYIFDDADVKQATGSTTLSVDTWYKIEIRLQQDNSGYITLYLDENSTPEVSATSIDTISGTLDGLALNGLGGSISAYFDDVYIKADTSDSTTTDLIGVGDGLEWEIPDYYQSVTGGISQGTSPAAGSIANTGENPLNDSNEAEWTGSTDDADWAADGARAGPTTDIDGTVLAGKYWIRADRDGGGATSHYLNTGKYNTTPTWTHTERLTTIIAGATDFWFIDSTNMPSTSSDSFAWGLRIDGARDVHVFECGAWFLQTVAAGTTQYKTVTGSITPSGALIRKGKKSLGGAITPSGEIASKKGKKLLSGTITPSGTVTKKATKLLSGELSFTGVLAAVKTLKTTLTGVLSFTGTLTRKVKKSLSGSITPSGTVTKKVEKAPLTGSITPSGELFKKGKKIFTGSIAPTGALTARIILTIILEGTLTFAGSLTKKVTKSLGGLISPTGTVTKKGKKAPFTGSITPSGVLLKKGKKIFSGAIIPSGELIKKVTKLLGGAITPSGILTKKGKKASFTGTITPSGALTKKGKKIFSGSIAPTGTVTKKAKKILTGAVSFVGTLAAEIAGIGETFYKTLTGSITPSGILTKKGKKSLSGEITPSGIVTKKGKKTLGGSISPSGSLLTRFIKWVFSRFWIQETVETRFEIEYDVTTRFAPIYSVDVVFSPD
jgi:hypothetical protein